MSPLTDRLLKKGRAFHIAVVLSLLFSAPAVLAQDALQTYNQRGVEAEQKQDYAMALANFTAGVKQFPENSSAYYNRGMFYFRRHQYQLALKDIEAAVKLSPSYLLFAVTRAGIYAKLGENARALNEYNHLLTIVPPVRSGMTVGPVPSIRAMTFSGRAWLEATCPDGRFRNGQQAIADAKKAVAIGGPLSNAYREALAAAYAETGDFDSAIRFEQEAIAHQSWDDPVRDPTGTMNAYRQHRPYRSMP
jgi:tetratricopeptide (TPR) repeat protein